MLTTGTGGISLYGDMLDGGNAVNIIVGGHIRAAGNIQAGYNSVNTSYFIAPKWTSAPIGLTSPDYDGYIIFDIATNRLKVWRDNSWRDLD